MVFFASLAKTKVFMLKLSEMPKTQNKHRKTRKLSKKREQYYRRLLRLWTLLLASIGFLIFFFNFSLTFTGSWDDLDAEWLLVAASFCLVALMVASFNVFKFRAQNYELFAPLAILGLSALFYFAVTVIGASSVMAGI
jgi:hypothetical protein